MEISPYDFCELKEISFGHFLVAKIRGCRGILANPVAKTNRGTVKRREGRNNLPAENAGQSNLVGLTLVQRFGWNFAAIQLNPFRNAAFEHCRNGSHVHSSHRRQMGLQTLQIKGLLSQFQVSRLT
jgi:hypothetical protein